MIFSCRVLFFVFHLSILSFGIESESRLPFFIASGTDECAIAVEFRRFAVNCARLLATCKAALALRRRGGESLELRATKNIIIFIFSYFQLPNWAELWTLKCLPLLEFNALRLLPVGIRSGLAVISLGV